MVTTWRSGRGAEGGTLVLAVLGLAGLLVDLGSVLDRRAVDNWANAALDVLGAAGILSYTRVHRGRLGGYGTALAWALVPAVAAGAGQIVGWRIPAIAVGLVERWYPAAPTWFSVLAPLSRVVVAVLLLLGVASAAAHEQRRILRGLAWTTAMCVVLLALTWAPVINGQRSSDLIGLDALALGLLAMVTVCLGMATAAMALFAALSPREAPRSSA